MRLQKMDVAGHGLKQYSFRINEKEIVALQTVIEIARCHIPRSPESPVLKELRRQISISHREMRKALKESNNFVQAGDIGEQPVTVTTSNPTGEITYVAANPPKKKRKPLK